MLGLGCSKYIGNTFSLFFFIVFVFNYPGPPQPPPDIRVNKKEVLITKSSINFTFNCSWFSDTNGAVKYFTVVVREADGKCHDVIPFFMGDTWGGHPCHYTPKELLLIY